MRLCFSPRFKGNGVERNDSDGSNVEREETLLVDRAAICISASGMVSMMMQFLREA